MNEPRRDWVWGALILRVAAGLLFLTAGLSKFAGGTAAFRAHLVEQFGPTWLPAFSVAAFGAVLPYLEVIVGALIVLGLFRFYAVAIGSLLMLSLAFGMMVAGQPAVTFNNMGYVALFAALLFTAPWDRLTLDALLARRTLASR